jgi:hypothetical protein
MFISLFNIVIDVRWNKKNNKNDIVVRHELVSID